VPLLNKVIVCDDEDAIAHLVAMALGDAGYLCLRARDGEQAVFLAAHEQPDLLVLDVMMPKLDGIEVCRRLRDDPALASIPILMLTSLAGTDDKVRGLEAGADDYLAKPFQMEELIARLNAVIRRRHAQPTGELRGADLVLDEERQTVRHGARTVELTATEFRLLRYFMLHPGRTLSKTTLAEHVYDYDSDKDSNVIEAYVRRLRRKLGQELIRTRRGQGYVFGERR
jgi:DNA-binding response OmpR family regulator